MWPPNDWYILLPRQIWPTTLKCIRNLLLIACVQRREKKPKFSDMLNGWRAHWSFGVNINRFIFPSSEIRSLNLLKVKCLTFLDKQIDRNPVHIEEFRVNRFETKLSNQSLDADRNDLDIFRCHVDRCGTGGVYFMRSTSNNQSSVTN